MSNWLIDGFNSLAEAIANYIGQGIDLLVSCVFYPVTMVCYWFSAIVGLIMDPFIEYHHASMEYSNMLYSFVFTVIGSVLPFKIAIIFFIGLTIILGYRLYHFVKHISIFGNSI